MGDCIGTKFAPPYSILFMGGLEEEIIKKIQGQKKLPCFRKSAGGKFFHHLLARIVVCVSEYIFFVSNKRIHIQKQKAKETKENRKSKETIRRKGERKCCCCYQYLWKIWRHTIILFDNLLCVLLTYLICQQRARAKKQ